MRQVTMGKEKDQPLPRSEMSPGRRPRGMLKRESPMTSSPATRRMEPARMRMRPRSGIVVALRTLDSIAQRFDHDVADQRGDERDDEVDGGDDVVDGPEEASASGGPGAREVPHDQVGIEEKDDEADFDRGPAQSFEHIGR